MQQQTTVTTSRGAHAYTAAFEELGLAWQWDPATHGAGREGLRAYLEKEQPHLLRAYEADFLLAAVEATRARLAGKG